MVNFTTDIWQPVMGAYTNTFYPKKSGAITPVFQDVGAGGSFISGTAGVARSVWSGLGTTGKVGVGAIGGAAAYGAYDWLFGGTKKDAPQQQVLDQKPTQNTTTNLNYNLDARQTTTTTTNIDNRSWMTIANSPGASMTKKDTIAATATATPAMNIPFTFSLMPTQDTSAQQAQAQGTDFTTLAIIGAIGLVAYGYTSRKGK